ncbi:MAG TPA: inorganic diphosphatase [Candidatus Kapabacteria bacterium]|nr:inorganic diphosphatase [Candidatus Kapabacteria bacterium]
MISYLDIPAGRDVPHILNAIIEIPRGSRNKYEYCPEYNCFELDRVLASPMHYPTAYGFIPSTLYVDGDPLDILVLMDDPTFTGCLMAVRPIGVMRMIDGTKLDDKVIAVAKNDMRYHHYNSLDDMKPHELVEIEYFYSVYKDLEGKQTLFKGWESVEYAHQIVTESIERFRETGRKP